jgi:NitT/TauT family transport system substrate-binding protein
MNRTVLKFSMAAAITAAVVISSLPQFSSTTASTNGTSTNITPSGESKLIKIGYFPNINHAQPMIGLANGDYQKHLGDDVEIKTLTFNAGPSAIEALYANAVDVTYVGPNPTINGYVQSQGKALKVIAGAASGGAVFVVRNDAGIDGPEDFAGKKFGSPQLGNTQDVALRLYLKEHGYETKENGGNVEVLPAKNADLLTLMIKGDLDGAWVPEPWGARMVEETNSKIFLDERDLWPNGKFVTVNLIARTDFLQKNPDLVKKLLEAHVEETIWINNNPEEARKQFNQQMAKLTGNMIPESQLQTGMSRMEITWDPIKSSLFANGEDQYKIGFFKENPDISQIYDLTILNQVLREKGLPVIE